MNNCKTYLSMLILLLLNLSIYAQKPQYQLSSHILDLSTGNPAPHVRIELQKQKSDKMWVAVATEKTDANGRVPNFLPTEKMDNKGIYKLVFYTESYFQQRKLDTFYPYVEVVFTIKDDKHYHVPITISPYGYATYRGN